MEFKSQMVVVYLLLLTGQINFNGTSPTYITAVGSLGNFILMVRTGMRIVISVQRIEFSAEM